MHRAETRSLAEAMAGVVTNSAQTCRLRHWLFRLVYPRVFTKAMSSDEARALIVASPFGAPLRECLILG